MDTNTAIKFIGKAIEKTKLKQLSWMPLSEDTFLKPIPTDNSKLVSSLSVTGGHLSVQDSYVTKYKTGQLLLLAYRSTSSLILCTPPDGCNFSLRMQDEKSKFATEISNSDRDNDEAINLIRLYNLIDKDSSSISFLIDDFLNS